jgi:L-rhamnose-H+ transport protein
MVLTFGLMLITLAGVLQGSFFLPMTYTRGWKWEHSWLGFSLLAMLVINWLLAVLLINGLGEIISTIPDNTFWIVLASGTVWGLGTILFGKAMEQLGMALGYPVIMGISAVAGMLIPAIIFSPEMFLNMKGWIILGGALISVVGVSRCGKAASKKTGTEATDKKLSGKWLAIGIISGFTSCLPNVGAAFSNDIKEIALGMGNKDYLAANMVWCLFFTMGALINMAYTVYLIKKGKAGRLLFYRSRLNWLLILGMSVMWIGSLYIYCMGSSLLGNAGLIAGWPLLVILSILIGNLWGIYRGEWASATANSRRMLNEGLSVLLVAVIVVALSNLL